MSPTQEKALPIKHVQLTGLGKGTTTRVDYFMVGSPTRRQQAECHRSVPARANTLADVRRSLKMEQVEVCPHEQTDPEMHLDTPSLSDTGLSETRRRWDYRAVNRSTFKLSELSCSRMECPCVKPPFHYGSLNQDRALAKTFRQTGKYLDMT